MARGICLEPPCKCGDPFVTPGGCVCVPGRPSDWGCFLTVSAVSGGIVDLSNIIGQATLDWLQHCCFPLASIGMAFSDELDFYGNNICTAEFGRPRELSDGFGNISITDPITIEVICSTRRVEFGDVLVFEGGVPIVAWSWYFVTIGQNIFDPNCFITIRGWTLFAREGFGRSGTFTFNVSRQLPSQNLDGLELTVSTPLNNGSAPGGILCSQPQPGSVTATVKLYRKGGENDPANNSNTQKFIRLFKNDTDQIVAHDGKLTAGRKCKCCRDGCCRCTEAGKITALFTTFGIAFDDFAFVNGRCILTGEVTSDVCGMAFSLKDSNDDGTDNYVSILFDSTRTARIVYNDETVSTGSFENCVPFDEDIRMSPGTSSDGKIVVSPGAILYITRFICPEDGRCHWDTFWPWCNEFSLSDNIRTDLGIAAVGLDDTVSCGDCDVCDDIVAHDFSATRERLGGCDDNGDIFATRFEFADTCPYLCGAAGDNTVTSTITSQVTRMLWPPAADVGCQHLLRVPRFSWAWQRLDDQGLDAEFCGKIITFDPLRAYEERGFNFLLWLETAYEADRYFIDDQCGDEDPILLEVDDPADTGPWFVEIVEDSDENPNPCEICDITANSDGKKVVQIG